MHAGHSWRIYFSQLLTSKGMRICSTKYKLAGQRLVLLGKDQCYKLENTL